MILVGSRRFESRATVERHVRDILSRHANASEMELLKGEDREFVRALIDLHQRAAIIVDCGIREIRVQRVPFNERVKRFFVVRTDGSWRDFSWTKCLYHRSQLQQVRSIARSIVRPQIQAFQRRFWREHPSGTLCPILGVPMSPRTTAHVDHFDPLFVELVNQWCELMGLDPEDIEIEHQTEYQGRSKFTDPSLEQSWAEFHQAHANLRVVSARANLSTLRRAS